MPLAGSCAVCQNLSHNLMICVYCGARVCPICIDPRSGGCKRCKGMVMRK